MYVSKIPDSARFIGRDLFDSVLYYENARFLYSFYIGSKKVLRSNKSILKDIELKV